MAAGHPGFAFVKLRYDAATDILHIDLAGKGEGTPQSVSAGVTVQVDDLGAPVGITIEHASANVDLSSIEATGLGGSSQSRVSSSIRVNVTSRASGSTNGFERLIG